MRRRGDPGEIQGRSIDLRSSVFRGVGGSLRRIGGGVESKVWGVWVKGGLGGGRGKDETRTIGCGGVLGSQGRSDEGARGATRVAEERGERKT